MKDETNMTPSEITDQDDPDLVSLLTSMQQQLHLLEKKLDLLLSRSQEKQPEDRASRTRSFARRSFPKTFRSYEHPQRHDKREREHGPRDRESLHGHFYEQRPQEKGRRPNPRKKPVDYKRKERE